MSPAPRLKSRGKKSAKEALKHPSKSSTHANTTAGNPAGGYNPLSGTFHTFDTVPVPSTTPTYGNSRFQNIDETDEQNGNTSGTGADYDSVSNNGSWSGESEDHKEKPSQPLPHQGLVPETDNDRREKIRQKNERKHQRQKERRAKELHERCSSLLMSRKLEALAQQLVAMGFSHERATMALIWNGGRVEESVAWLLEGTEDGKLKKQQNLNTMAAKLKIDVSEELCHLKDIEIRYSVSKQEVERIVVSCEGDLKKAEETLRLQKAVPSKSEEPDPPTVGNIKQLMAIQQNPTRIHPSATLSAATQRKNDQKESSVDTRVETINVWEKSMPPSEVTQPKLIARPAEKMWVTAGSNPSPAFSLASLLQASLPVAITDVEYLAIENSLKNLQLGSLKPAVLMQQPQTMNSKPALSVSLSSSPPGMPTCQDQNSIDTGKPNGSVPQTTNRKPALSVSLSSSPHSMPTCQDQNSIDTMKPNGSVPQTTNRKLALSVSLSSSPGSMPTCQDQNSLDTVNPNGSVPPVPISRSLVHSVINANPLHRELHRPLHPQLSSTSNSSMDSLRIAHGNCLQCREGASASPALAASSLGLFSCQSSGSSSPVDWNMGGSLPQLDYTNVDWSMNCGSLSSPGQGGLWTGAKYSIQSNGCLYGLFGYGLDARSSSGQILSNGNGNAVSGVGSMTLTPGGLWDWSLPFEEIDNFRVPRQFVSSPSL